jgi:hypothetical protein
LANCDKRPWSLVSHSHTVNTRQPRATSAALLRESRFALPCSFSRQKPRLLAGMYAYRQPGCWCQKHPCTFTTARNFGSNKSGFPGSRWTWSRKRRPCLCRYLRTSTSGFVFFPLIPDIMRLRVERSTISAISLPSSQPQIQMQLKPIFSWTHDVGSHRSSDGFYDWNDD